MTDNPQFLTTEEKRAWLARIFRDTSGEYTDADKFKAMEVDNRLVELEKNPYIVQPATVTMTTWPCETDNTINDSNRLSIDDINKRYICEKITNLQQSNNTAPNPELEEIAFIPAIVKKDKKTWDMVRIILIDSNNKPFRDEIGEIYSSLMPTHALLHSKFTSPEYKKQLLSHIIISPKKTD